MPSTYFLGFKKLDQYTSLALDEVITKRAENGDTFIRTFKISPPAVTIAQMESTDDVYADNVKLKGYDFTRRPTPGSAIFIDDSMLCLSVAAPASEYTDAFDTHKKLSTGVAQAMRELGAPTLYIGNWFSIRTTNKVNVPNVLAGFSIDWNTRSVLYHGVIRLRRQHPELVRELIKFRTHAQNKESGITRHVDELEYFKNLPVLSDIMSVDEDVLSSRIVDKLSKGGYEKMSDNEYAALLEEARKISELKYKNREWVSDGKTKKEANLGYCLADLVYPEARILSAV